MPDERVVSPYLRRPLRSLDEALRDRRNVRDRRREGESRLDADNNNHRPSAKSA